MVHRCPALSPLALDEPAVVEVRESLPAATLAGMVSLRWEIVSPEEMERRANHPDAIAQREYEEKHRHRQRPHCSGCGRFGRYRWPYFDCTWCGEYRID